jgi:hypothetical protein
MAVIVVTTRMNALTWNSQARLAGCVLLGHHGCVQDFSLIIESTEA